MTLLDTDTVSLLLAGNPKVLGRLRRAEEDLAITVITKVEILQGRFDSLLKARDGDQLQRAQLWLERTEANLDHWAVVRVNAAAAIEFDRLRQLKTVRKVGRADMLIASIALAHRATLVTRNLRDFRLISGLILDNWAD